MDDYNELVKRGEAIQIVWLLDDVFHQAREDGVELTVRQAKEVLQMLDREHDATVGVNWDTISYWIQEVTSDDYIW